MTEHKAEAGFIIRVVCRKGRRHIVVHDLRTGRSQEFSSWSRVADSLRHLSNEAKANIR